VNDLLEAVDRLTKPQKHTNRQRSHVHTWINVAREDEEPELVCEFEAAHDVLASVPEGGEDVTLPALSLVEQLRLAVVSNIGGGSGASKAARERTPLDVTAFTLLEQIDGRVRSWVDEFGESRSGGLEWVVRRWYSLFTRYPREEAVEGRYVGILSGWAQQIEDLMDPPARQEITSPCPACGQLWVTRGQKDDTESVRALWASWRSTPENSDASCQGCGKVWHGVMGMRSLRMAIDDAEKASSNVA
jgi:hypothetical protein